MTRAPGALALAALLGAGALAAQAGPGKYPLFQVNQTAVPAMYQDAKGANWSVIDGWIELYDNGSFMMKLNYRDPQGRKHSTTKLGDFTRSGDSVAFTPYLSSRSFPGVVHAPRLDIAYDVDNDHAAERLSFGQPGPAAPQPTAAAAQTAPPPTAPAPAAAPPPVAPAAAAPNAAEVKTFGDVSFAVPPGWRYEAPSGDGPATVALGSGDDAVTISVYRPARSSGDATADFSAAWARVLGGAPSWPPYDHQSPVGYPGKYYSSEGDRYGKLYLLEAGSDAVPVLVMTRDHEAFEEHYVAITLFIEGIRRAPLRAEPVKTTITLADLAGKWSTGGESSAIYVTSAGNYAGSSIVAHSETYVIAADGSFTYSYGGISNGQTVQGQGDGRLELGEGMLTLQMQGRNGGESLHRYHILAYQTALSGATLIWLLDAQYETTAANIQFYGEKWIRAGTGTPGTR